MFTGRTLSRYGSTSYRRRPLGDPYGCYNYIIWLARLGVAAPLPLGAFKADGGFYLLLYSLFYLRGGHFSCGRLWCRSTDFDGYFLVFPCHCSGDLITIDASRFGFLVLIDKFYFANCNSHLLLLSMHT